MIGVLLLSLAWAGQDDLPPPAPLEGPFQDMVFKDDLYQVQDLTLLGLDAIASVTFPRPSSWALIQDPELHLLLDHSAMLGAERSTLTVKINDVALDTFSLDRTNAVQGEMVVILPRRLLQDHNRLQLQASQHVVAECEDPYDPSLWTRIRNESFIRFYRTLEPTKATLSNFPDVLLDPSGHGPLRLTLAGRGTPGPSTLQAASRIALSLGRHAGYRGVSLSPSVARISKAETAVLVVGTPQDNPLTVLLADADDLPPGQGLILVRPHPTHRSKAILVVTGADDAGLIKAANALASADVHELLSGPRVLIDESLPSAIPTRDELPRAVPPALSFTMKDLGLKDQTVRGTYSSPISIPLAFQADTVVRQNGASLRLDYAYGAQLDPNRSTVEVLLNGVSIRSVPLARPGGDPEARLRVDLRSELLHPTSLVTVIFHLVPGDQEECALKRNRQLWGTVFDSSRFEVDRAHIAALPDLALLRHALWPLGPGLSHEGIAILLPDKPGWDVFSAAFQAAAELGRVSTSTDADMVMVAGGHDTLVSVSGRQLLVLSDGSPHTPLQILELTGAVKARGGTSRRLTGPDGTILVDVEVTQRATTMEQVIYQTEPVRTALLLQASEAGALLALVASLGDPHTLQRLDGSAAFLELDGSIATHALTKRIVVGKKSVWGRVQILLSSTGLPLALVLAFVGTLATIMVSRWASGRHGQV